MAAKLSGKSNLNPSAEPLKELMLFAPDLVTKVVKDPFGSGFDPRTAEVGRYVLTQSGSMLSAIVQLNGCIEDMRAVHSMLGKYPWREDRISRAKHLDLNWFLFQNLCYKFKEKLKLAFNSQRKIAKSLILVSPSWLKEELKLIETALGRHIQDRGNTVHNWNVTHGNIDLISMIELFKYANLAGETVDLPEHFLDLTGHFRDAKWFLRLSIKRAIHEADSSLARILATHEPTPKEIVKYVDEIMQRVLRGEIRFQ